MLTSIFNKSKPINFLLAGIFMSVFYVLANFFDSSTTAESYFYLKKIAGWFVYLFLMFLVNFIVKRNQVTKKNTFAIFFFAVFSVMFYPLLASVKILIVGMLLLLALRRVVSLRTGKEMKKKIFDTAFWICISFFIYPSTGVFMVLPFLGVLLYTPQDVKNWILPFLAITSVFILAITFNLLVYDQFFVDGNFSFSPTLDFSTYNHLKILLPLSVLIAFTLWALVYFFRTISATKRNIKPSLYLILTAWLLSLLAIIFSAEKTGAELLFFIIPASVIGANYFERKGEKVFKEVLLVSLLLLTFAIPFL